MFWAVVGYQVTFSLLGWNRLPTRASKPEDAGWGHAFLSSDTSMRQVLKGPRPSFISLLSVGVSNMQTFSPYDSKFAHLRHALSTPFAAVGYWLVAENDLDVDC